MNFILLFKMLDPDLREDNIKVDANQIGWERGRGLDSSGFG
jgi:hypothetical protein